MQCVSVVLMHDFMLQVHTQQATACSGGSPAACSSRCESAVALCQP